MFSKDNNPITIVPLPSEDGGIWRLVSDISNAELIDSYLVNGIPVKIFQKDDGLHYHITEPHMDERTLSAYAKTYNHMLDSGDVDIDDITEDDLMDEFKKSAKKIRTYEIIKRHYNDVKYYLIRDILGMGIFDILQKDDMLENFALLKVTQPVVIHHRKHTPGRMIQTNIIFEDMYDETEKKIQDKHEVLGHALDKIAAMIGKNLTESEPYHEGRLPSGERVTVWTRDVTSPDSGALSIRKPLKTPITITMLLQQNIIPYGLAALIWTIFDTSGGTGIVYGAPNSGKTTITKALADMVNPFTVKVTVEDTDELNLEQKNVLKTITKKSNRENSVGYANLFDRVMRFPTGFVGVGEIRTKDIEGLLHLFNSGCSAIATFHGTHENAVVSRLNTLGVKQSQLLDIWFLMGMGFVDVGGRRERRVLAFSESYEKDGNVLFERVVHFDAASKQYVGADIEELCKSRKAIESAYIHGVDSYTDLESRQEFLKKIVGRKIFSSKEVEKAFTEYYADLQKTKTRDHLNVTS